MSFKQSVGHFVTIGLEWSAHGRYMTCIRTGRKDEKYNGVCPCLVFAAAERAARSSLSASFNASFCGLKVSTTPHPQQTDRRLKLEVLSSLG